MLTIPLIPHRFGGNPREETMTSKTEQNFIAAEQAKQDAKLAKQLRQVARTGHITWSKAEALLANDLIAGAMQSYTLTNRGLRALSI
jgi:hypothetical protein